MDRDKLLGQAISILSPEGEDKVNIYKFQIAALIPAAITALITDIITGQFSPKGIGNSATGAAKNSGQEGNVVDYSYLKEEVKTVFTLTSLISKEFDLTSLVSTVEPMVIETPFIDVTSVNAGESFVYLPDSSMFNYKKRSGNNIEKIPYYTLKGWKLLVAYTGDITSIEITGHKIPSLANVSRNVEPHLLSYLLSMFRGK